jgi:threonine dehydrogenase-like Zn-dependent dehydrogenase
MTVYASGRHEQRLNMARDLGAAEVFDPESDPARVLADRGVEVDVTADTTGRDFSRDMFLLMKHGGVIAPFGIAWPWWDNLGPFTERDIVIANGGVEDARRTIDDIMQWIAQGTMPIERTITHRIPLDDLTHGFDVIKKREAVKVIVEFP